jgi:copper oxidase (laccase) domain-containing protein
MKSEFKSSPSDIIAAVGPAICGRCYTVGSDVIDEMKKVIDFIPVQSGDKFLIDLKEINRKLLVAAGVLDENISISPDCTYCKNNEYQSYRYHKNTKYFQISYIKI